MTSPLRWIKCLVVPIWVTVQPAHFVNTIHNGIAYADMQLIAEIYAVMMSVLRLPYADMYALFQQWNKGVLNAYLLEITADILGGYRPGQWPAIIGDDS